MAIMESPPDTDDALSPGLIAWVLQHYDSLLDMRRLPDPDMPLPAFNASSDSSRERRMALRASVKQVLAWLYLHYPIEADAVTAYYYEDESVARIAVWQGSSEPTVYRRIKRGVLRMSYRTGWVKAKRDTD